MVAPDPLEEAVQRMCGDGDGDAFRVVYRSVHPPLLRYLTVLVGPVDAEDVGSETWAQACRDLDSFTGDADGFRAWITTIGRHRALDFVRRRGRRIQADQDLTEVEVADPREVETEVIETFTTEGVVALIRSLPQDQAEAVWLRSVMGLDVRTAATIMGKRSGAVRSATHRGLRALARRLDPGDDSLPGPRDISGSPGAERVR